MSKSLHDIRVGTSLLWLVLAVSTPLLLLAGGAVWLVDSLPSAGRDLVLTLLVGVGLVVLGVLAATALARRLVGALRAVGQGDN